MKSNTLPFMPSFSSLESWTSVQTINTLWQDR